MPQVSGVSVCRECPGFCCKLMFLPVEHGEMESVYREALSELRGLLKSLSKTEDPSMCLLIRISEQAKATESARFGMDHFKPVEGVVNEDGKPVGEGGYITQYPYTCDQFDQETGNCTCYWTRPWTCQSYVCDSAMSGEVPTLENFPYSKQLTKEQIETIKKNRECTEKEIESVEPE